MNEPLTMLWSLNFATTGCFRPSKYRGSRGQMGAIFSLGALRRSALVARRVAVRCLVPWLGQFDVGEACLPRVARRARLLTGVHRLDHQRAHALFAERIAVPRRDQRLAGAERVGVFGEVMALGAKRDD